MKRSSYVAAVLTVLLLNNCQEEVLPETGTQLDHYIESFELSGLGFEPQLKVDYSYSGSGKIASYAVSSYNPDTGEMEDQRHFEFTYANDKVDQIRGYLAGQTNSYVDYSYEYLPDGKVYVITEENHSAGINSAATFDYGETGFIKVAYVYSNGGSFEYEFDYATGNILTDKTTRGSQLCSDGEYTYDQHPNPFKDLGYVDYLLTNLSSNNRLTESVNYVGCAFPSLIPESYTYEYNDKGYPASSTTIYKSDGVVAKSRREFFYASSKRK